MFAYELIACREVEQKVGTVACHVVARWCDRPEIFTYLHTKGHISPIAKEQVNPKGYLFAQKLGGCTYDISP